MGVKENQKAKGKRQKAKIRKEELARPLSSGSLLIFAFCLLPFTFCLLIFDFPAKSVAEHQPAP
jgi:hypothetical protein